MANEHIEEYVKKITANEVYKVHQGNYEQLKYAAQIFLDRVRDIADLNHQIVSQNSIKTQMSKIHEYMKKDVENTRQALQLQHIFETQLNDFMGRVIYLTYVDKEGNINFYDDANIGKLYSQATKESKGRRGNISASKMFETIDLEQELREKMLISIAERKLVYQQAIRRWEKNKTQDYVDGIPLSGKDYNPSKNTFYWRLNDYHITGWTDPISNRGWIAEGYAGAVINEDPQVKSKAIESSLKQLWEEHIQQDSIGGAIKGDIVLRDNGNIQFAVKSGSFSTARFGQYVRLAYNIQQIDILTPEQFEKVLPVLVNFRKATTEIIQAARKKGQQEITFTVNKQQYSVNF